MPPGAPFACAGLARLLQWRDSAAVKVERTGNAMPIGEGGAVPESAHYLARDRDVRLAVYAGWFLWIALTVIISVLVLLHPSRSDFADYYDSVADWWSGLPLYRPGAYGFLYLPSSPLIFSPFVALGAPAGDMAWRIFSVALFTYGLWRLVRIMQPRHARVMMPTVLVLLLPSAGVDVQRGQAEIAMVACTFLAASYAAESLWWRAAIWLCVGVALKPLAFVPLLLYGALFGPMRRPLAIGLIVILLMPFFHPDPAYVAAQYVSAFGKLVQSAAPGPYHADDFNAMLNAFGVDLPVKLMIGLRFVAALATLGLGTVAVQRLSREQASITVTSLAIAYLMVFNPRTELGSYVDLAAVAGLNLGVVWNRRGSGQRTALLFGLLMLGLGTQAYGNWIYHLTKIWLKPVLALAYFCYLAQFVIRAPRAEAPAEAAGFDANVHHGSSAWRSEGLLRDPANSILFAGLGAVLIGVLWGWPFFAASARNGSVPTSNASYWIALAGPEDPGPYPPSNLLLSDPQYFWEHGIGNAVALVIHLKHMPRTATRYSLATGSHLPEAIARMSRAWELEGFRDGHWTVVDRREGLKPWSASEMRSFSVQNPGKYDRYRFVFPATTSPGLIRIYRLEMVFAK